MIQHSAMKQLFTFLFLALSFVLIGCEKNIANEEQEDKKQGTGNNTSASAGSIDDGTKTNAMTVAEAQEAKEGSMICVKGYIVGATQKSINNIEFESPFSSSTAIVLSDKRVTGEDQEFYVSDVFPVCLTDAAKGIRDAFNLKDNPQYANSFVYIYGTREKYMGLPGLKNVQSIEVDANHIPEDNGNTSGGDNGQDNNNNDNNNDNGNEGGGTEEGGQEDNNQQESGNNDETVSYLTVAEAKGAASGTSITVQGYIVGAVSGVNFGATIDYSFEKPTFNNNKAGLILADKPYDESVIPDHQFDLTDFTDLLFVGLNDCSPTTLKKRLNLVENPQNQNKLIQITGTSRAYLIKDGLREITSYKFIE